MDGDNGNQAKHTPGTALTKQQREMAALQKIGQCAATLDRLLMPGQTISVSIARGRLAKADGSPASVQVITISKPTLVVDLTVNA